MRVTEGAGGGDKLRRPTDARGASLYFKMPLPLEGGEGGATLAEEPE